MAPIRNDDDGGPERDLGKVLFALGGIQSRLDAIERQMTDERNGSSQHRQDLRIVISSLTQSNQDIGSKLAALSERVREIEPFADQFRDMKAEARGAGKVVLGFRALILAVATGVGGIITYLAKFH